MQYELVIAYLKEMQTPALGAAHPTDEALEFDSFLICQALRMATLIATADEFTKHSRPDATTPADSPMVAASAAEPSKGLSNKTSTCASNATAPAGTTSTSADWWSQLGGWGPPTKRIPTLPNLDRLQTEPMQRLSSRWIKVGSAGQIIANYVGLL